MSSNRKRRISVRPIKYDNGENYESSEDDPLIESSKAATNSALHTIVYYLQKIDQRLGRIDHRVGSVEKIITTKIEMKNQPEFEIEPEIQIEPVDVPMEIVTTPHSARVPTAKKLTRREVTKTSGGTMLFKKRRPSLGKEFLEINHDESNEGDVTNDEVNYDQPFELPCKSVEAVTSLELVIRKNRVTYNGLVDFLTQLNYDTENYKKVISTCFKAIFGDETALHFNWTGRGGKMRRQVSNLCIIEIVTEVCLRLFDNVDLKDITRSQMRWFLYAEQRYTKKPTEVKQE